MAKCRLCNREALLQESHIIPKFVIRWLKDSSATGFFRTNSAVNLRSQDGPKAPMLCIDCEAMLGQWESEVAKRIFLPFAKNQPRSLPYGPWLLKFAVSVSWRSLITHVNATNGQEETTANLPLIEKALDTWREFLFDRRPHPSTFEQHIMLLDAIQFGDQVQDLPPNINRFLIRGLQLNLAYSDKRPAFIFTKMGRMALFGFIEIRHPRRWKGTKVHVRGGRVGGDIEIPSQLLNYLTERANKAHELHTRISPRQQEVIAESLRRDPDRAARSETFEAMSHDVQLFGSAAFFEDDDLEEK